MQRNNSKSATAAALKILLAVVLLIIVILLCVSRSSLTAKTCVNMPEPEDAVCSFFDALTDGRHDACDAMLANYSTLGLTSSTDTAIGKQLSELLQKSYNYTTLTGSRMPAVVSASDITSDTDASALVVFSNIDYVDIASAMSENRIEGKTAYQAALLTYLDISSMSDDLHELVTEIAYGYAYESVDVNNEETATMIVIEALCQLSENIENYYRTDVIVIKLEYTDGEWKLVLSDELYSAVIGNIA